MPSDLPIVGRCLLGWIGWTVWMDGQGLAGWVPLFFVCWLVRSVAEKVKAYVGGFLEVWVRARAHGRSEGFVLGETDRRGTSPLYSVSTI